MTPEGALEVAREACLGRAQALGNFGMSEQCLRIAEQSRRAAQVLATLGPFVEAASAWMEGDGDYREVERTYRALIAEKPRP